ncbi:MAG: hypothetical protein M0P04_03380 [Syntrophales bacterium]|jgi:nucleoside-triphosphatase THEP1|nr:hypothetical protein [Syntrophales bacterium]MDD4338911.1 nucleoside-triphosphatase [Syntrophales bacterium]HOG06772.1 nucleoside-triphosphatase [Syntrophales bacterium]HOS76961.1 nucleoside-triphosphatase [Syntrophales bacterium]HPB69583.1 nucleoside-triphosphatase [Syntrophales bacterium]
MNVLLSGATRDGRTGLADGLADQFRRQDLLPGGFLCLPAERDGAGPTYVIRDLLSGQARPFAHLHNPERAPAAGETAIGRWRVDAAGFAFGAQAVGRAVTLKTPLVFLDEIGPLELAGGGFRWLADLLIRGPLKPPVFIGIVREEVVPRVRGLYPDQVFDVVRAGARPAAEIYADLRRAMRGLGTQLRELR